jgi:hypothetical protein
MTSSMSVTHTTMTDRRVPSQPQRAWSSRPLSFHLLFVWFLVLFRLDKQGRQGTTVCDAFPLPVLLPGRVATTTATTNFHPLQHRRSGHFLSIRNHEEDADGSTNQNQEQRMMDVTQDARLYRVRLSRAVGIE